MKNKDKIEERFTNIVVNLLEINQQIDHVFDELKQLEEEMLCQENYQK